MTLETKSKQVLVLGADNLKRRDRTPQDCGYYIEFKNGRTIRHDFDSNEDCRAFVAALNRGESEPVVTEEAEARAEQAAAELLAELGLDNSPNESAGGNNAKKSKRRASLNRGETQPVMTKETEARAEQAATELLAELGLDNSPTSVPTSGDKAKKSKKKKGGKKKKK